MLKVLIVEDEPGIANVIQRLLSKVNYGWEYAKDGKEAADLIEANQYDLVLLDIMLPVYDGYELLEYIKTTGTPVIFITAKDQVEDRVKGLRLGADDYIVKPFDSGELLARIDAVMRRANKSAGIMHIDDTVIDSYARTVTQKGEVIDLTKKEFDLLLDLVRNRGMVLYRESLYERVWQDEYNDGTRTLDLHIQRLRKKLGWHDKIKTVIRVGYRLDA